MRTRSSKLLTKVGSRPETLPAESNCKPSRFSNSQTRATFAFILATSANTAWVRAELYVVPHDGCCGLTPMSWSYCPSIHGTLIPWITLGTPPSGNVDSQADVVLATDCCAGASIPTRARLVLTVIADTAAILRWRPNRFGLAGEMIRCPVSSPPCDPFEGRMVFLLAQCRRSLPAFVPSAGMGST